MSNTRRAPDNSPLSQEKYMSSPEYAELRGLSGNAVARKAAYLAHPRKKSLLFWLQAMSLRPGGLTKLAKEFLDAFADRIGTPTLRAHRLLSDQKCYPLNLADRIDEEMHGKIGEFIDVSAERLLDDSDYTKHLEQQAQRRRAHQLRIKNTTRGEWLAKCRYHAERKLVPMLIEVAINPKVQIPVDGEAAGAAEKERERFKYLHDRLGDDDFSSATLDYFDGFIPALLEFQDRHAANVQQGFVHTNISREVFTTLDRALKRPGRCALIEGAAGVGKSAAVKAWVEQHLGEARMVSLVGVSHKTGFFRSIAKVLGLASSYARTATEMQARVEDVLQSSRLMVIIDEAQFGFSSGDRPVALVATESFGRKLMQAEQQVLWAGADAFKRRLRPHVKLPAKPLMGEMLAIARKQLPTATEAAIKEIVGYAGATDYPITNLVDAVQDSLEIAADSGRTQVTYDDARRAVTECRERSDAASKQSFGGASGPRQRRQRESTLQPKCSEVAAPPNTPEKSEDFAGHAPDENPRFQPVNSGRTARDLVTH